MTDYSKPGGSRPLLAHFADAIPAADKLGWVGKFDTDYSLLADYVAGLDAAISRMPPPSVRNKALRAEVRKIISNQNSARSQFLTANVIEVYRILTNDLCDHCTIVELCERGTVTLPALLPTTFQMAAERALSLDKREGRELSQASFIACFLRNTKCGKHILASMRRPGSQSHELLREYERERRLHLGVVTIEQQGHAAIITLQNEDYLNAEDLQFLLQLEAAVDVALLSSEVRVCVVRGGVMKHPKYRGRRVFCAGINLKKLSVGEIPIVEYLLSREMGLIEKFRRGLYIANSLPGDDLRFEKPWLGVVEAFAIGGGFQMLLNFDKVIASDEVYFSLPAAHEGIVPGTANFRLARNVGSKLARRMILSGEKIYAGGQNGALVCDDVVDIGSIDKTLESAIEQLSSAAVSANRHMLNLSDEPQRELLNYLAEFCIVQSERALSEDVIAKIKAW